jgi:hypothetical protein
VAGGEGVNTDPMMLLEEIKAIYDAFLRSTAPFEINLSSSLREDINTKMNDYVRFLTDPAALANDHAISAFLIDFRRSPSPLNGFIVGSKAGHLANNGLRTITSTPTRYQLLNNTNAMTNNAIGNGENTLNGNGNNGRNTPPPLSSYPSGRQTPGTPPSVGNITVDKVTLGLSISAPSAATVMAVAATIGTSANSSVARNMVSIRIGGTTITPTQGSNGSSSSNGSSGTSTTGGALSQNQSISNTTPTTANGLPSSRNNTSGSGPQRNTIVAANVPALAIGSLLSSSANGDTATATIATATLPPLSARNSARLLIAANAIAQQTSNPPLFGGGDSAPSTPVLMVRPGTSSGRTTPGLFISTGGSSPRGGNNGNTASNANGTTTIASSVPMLTHSPSHSMVHTNNYMHNNGSGVMGTSSGSHATVVAAPSSATSSQFLRANSKGAALSARTPTEELCAIMRRIFDPAQDAILNLMQVPYALPIIIDIFVDFWLVSIDE